MNKNEKLKSHKMALLCSLVLDAEIEKKITDICEDIIYDLYGIKSLSQDTYLQELSNEVEDTVTSDSNELARLLRDSLKDLEVEKSSKANELLKALDEYLTEYRKNMKQHYKIETIIRRNFKNFK